VTFAERPIVFACAGDELLGILSVPPTPMDVGVVIVVGGPQYRAGSHRQFVHLARALGRAGIASLRFDYRGMGDSTGALRTFEQVDEDIAAAIAALQQNVPTARRVVLWGLCDGASAAFIAARSLGEIVGMVALNPWVRDETSLDRALVKHYYVRRLFSWGFWAKLVGGRLDTRSAAREFLRRLRVAFSGGGVPGIPAIGRTSPSRYQDLMCEGLATLRGPALIVLSGKDLTAQEYETFSKADRRWRKHLADRRRFTTKQIADADHTFSNDEARIEVENMTCDFVLSLASRTAADASPARGVRIRASRA
jgi:exosortase A-associated hydrolase 1